MTGAERPAPGAMKEVLDTIVETVLATAGDVKILMEERDTTARATVKETVAALTATLATMEPPAPSADMALLLADCRETITEGIGALHTQGADVLHALQILQAPPAKAVPPSHPTWLVAGVGVLLGMGLMGATWWVWPDGGYRSFLVGLDAVLVKHYPQLPSSAQDAVTAVYGRHQFQTPGSRQKGK